MRQRLYDSIVSGAQSREMADITSEALGTAITVMPVADCQIRTIICDRNLYLWIMRRYFW